MAGAALERPGVVGAAQRRGQPRVLDVPVPQQAERGVQHLHVEPLGVHEPQPPVHVLPVRAGVERAVEPAHRGAALLLPIADDGAEHIVDVHPDVERLAVHQQARRAVRVPFHAHGPLPKGRLDVVRIQVQRLDEMAVAVHDLHGVPPVRSFSFGMTYLNIPSSGHSRGSGNPRHGYLLAQG